MNLDVITNAVIAKGDLAHLALFLWATGASALLFTVLRDLARSKKRFDDFVRASSRASTTAIPETNDESEPNAPAPAGASARERAARRDERLPRLPARAGEARKRARGIAAGAGGGAMMN